MDIDKFMRWAREHAARAAAIADVEEQAVVQRELRAGFEFMITLCPAESARLRTERDALVGGRESSAAAAMSGRRAGVRIIRKEPSRQPVSV